MAGEVDEPATAHFGAVRKSRNNVLPHQLRVIRQNLFRSFSCGEEVQNEGDLNTRTPDTRFTETNVLVHGDPAEQRIHVSLLRLQDIVVYRRGAAPVESRRTNSGSITIS